MTRDPVVARPDTTLREPARTVREVDSAVLPIGESDRRLGILTDHQHPVDPPGPADADGHHGSTRPWDRLRLHATAFVHSPQRAEATR